LLDAAVDLISEKGVDGLRLREIGERADIGFGSFYAHFASKEELVEAVVADRVGAVTAEMAERANAFEDPAETIAVAHRLFLRVAHTDPTLARLMIRLERGEDVLAGATVPVLTDVLRRGVASGRFPEADTELLGPFVVGATMAVLRGMVEGTLGPGAEDKSARALLRACGLSDAEAAGLANRPLLEEEPDVRR
jgi:AcrR family transcriptional regulator